VKPEHWETAASDYDHRRREHRDGFDPLHTLLDSDHWRGVLNLLRQPDSKGFWEKVIPASDLVVEPRVVGTLLSQ
jgi:hypothetical protein